MTNSRVPAASAGEKECLFPPCSFLEPLGTEAVEVTSFGVLGKVRVRLNANLKARSLAELVAQKRIMHNAAFGYLISELERELREQLDGPECLERMKTDQYSKEWDGNPTYLVDRIVEQCREVKSKHGRVSTEDFLDDDMYRSLVSESLMVKDMGKDKFNLWLRGTETAWAIASKGLKECWREWGMRQEQRLATLSEEEGVGMALALCRSKGLLRTSVDERDIFGETPLLSAAGDGAK